MAAWLTAPFGDRLFAKADDRIAGQQGGHLPNNFSETGAANTDAGTAISHRKHAHGASPNGATVSAHGDAHAEAGANRRGAS